MGIAFKGQDNNGTLWAVWRIQETEETLWQMYLSHGVEAEPALLKKKGAALQQSCAARLAVAELTPLQGLTWSEEGAPRLASGFLSLSHTADWAAAAFHPNKRVGIDIEAPRAQLDRIAEKFSLPEERALFTPENKLHGLLGIWTAKEALFKAYGLGAVDFRKHLRLEPFHPESEGSIRAHVRLDNSPAELHYHWIENCLCTRALLNP